MGGRHVGGGRCHAIEQCGIARVRRWVLGQYVGGRRRAADARVRAAVGDPNLSAAQAAGVIISILAGKLPG